MPSQLIYDISAIDLNNVIYGQDAIREYNPQRGHMEMLNGIVYIDQANDGLIGYKDVREDEFWVAGHIPGRPLLPGVLMIETAAQLAGFYARKFIGWDKFIGFGGVEECKFRLPVIPPARLYVLGKQIWVRHRRVFCEMQGVVNGSLVFETKILGVQM